MKIGVISREDYKKRTIAIARGEYKPKRGEPKIWFESVQSPSYDPLSPCHQPVFFHPA